MIAFLRILLFGWLGSVVVIECLASGLRPKGQIDVAVFTGLAATFIFIAIALIGVLVRALVHGRHVQVPRAIASLRSGRAS